jgi:hypothetical protein
MKLFWCFIIATGICHVSLAAGDTIIVHKDARMDLLQQKQAQINKRSSMLTSSGQYKGFRVQVMSTSSRDEAFKKKADMQNLLPEEKSYVIFQSPSYKVRVGNCISRDDAEKLKAKVNKFVTQGGFIVEDTIEYTAEEEVSQE